MGFEFSPLCEALGAEIHGLVPETIDRADAQRLRQALHDYAVLLVRGLDLTPAAHVELTRAFGDPEIHPIESIRHEQQPEIIVLGAGQSGQPDPDDPSGDDLIGALPWHSDLSYAQFPCRGALLYPRRVVPDGGQTGFLDTASVYDALPTAMKDRIEGLEVLHALGPIQEVINRAAEVDYAAEPEAAPQFAPVVHPLVHRLPETGRKALNLSTTTAQSIIGLPEEESRTLLRELTEFATQRHFTYFHSWRLGELIVWDNWRTMHIVTGFKRRHPRLMHRTTLRGGAALCA